jgi:hypothetical protein
LGDAGDYFVTVGISLFDIFRDTFPRFALTLNGIFVPGSNININATFQMTTVSTIIHVPFPGSVLRLINNSGMSETLGSFNSNDIVAFITLEKLHDPNTP